MDYERTKLFAEIADNLQKVNEDTKTAEVFIIKARGELNKISESVKALWDSIDCTDIYASEK